MTGDPLDPQTTALLCASLRTILARHEPDHDLDAALDQLGWATATEADPATTNKLLFTEHGRALAQSRALDTIILAELSESLPATSNTRAILYPTTGWRGLPQGTRTRGIVLAPLCDETELVIPVQSGHETAIALAFDPVTLPPQGFTAPAGCHTVELTVQTGSPANEPWQRAVSAAHRALAAELIGVCEVALEIAVRHVTNRHQYGRPIGSFQAVRHRLAEALVRIQAAREVLDIAWRPGAGAVEASLAKIIAGRAQSEIMPTLIQVQGAIGLTLEGTTHRYLTRGALLDNLLGDHNQLAEQLGSDMLDGVVLPAAVTIA